METWHNRLQEALDVRGYGWSDLITVTGKKMPSVYGWKPDSNKRTEMMDGNNAALVCDFLKINPLWLFHKKGKSGLECSDGQLPAQQETAQSKVSSFANRRSEDHPAIAEVVKLMLEMDDPGKWMLAGEARSMQKERPKANPAKSFQ